MELTTYVFEEGGPHNTEKTLEVAVRRAQALGIRQMVVASSHGGTARRLHALAAPLGIRVVAVTISHVWEDKGWCMDEATAADLRALGIPVITGIHALGDGVGSAFTRAHGGRVPEEIVRETLYRFCQGMKVAVECAMMAADAGALDLRAEAVAIAGSGDGADTAIVCQPACAQDFYRFEIREILAKPRRAQG